MSSKPQPQTGPMPQPLRAPSSSSNQPMLLGNTETIFLSATSNGFFKANYPTVVTKRSKNFNLTGEVRESLPLDRGLLSVKDSFQVELQAEGKIPMRLRHGSVNREARPSGSLFDKSISMAHPEGGVRQSLMDSMSTYVDKIKQKSVDKKRQMVEVEKTLCSLKQKIFALETKNDYLRKEIAKIRGKMANYEHYNSSRETVERKIGQMAEKIKSNDLAEKFFKIKLENETKQKEKLESILYEVCVEMKENSPNLEIKKLIFQIKSLKNQLRQREGPF